MIRVRDLRVDFDNTCAVRDVSFEVGPGVCFGLIGPNGAGKTTTMRAILGLIEPTYGHIEVNHIDIREKPEDGAKQIGFMPDFPPMYEDLLVWEFLDLFAASYHVPRSQRVDVIDQYLEMVKLTEKRNAFIPELSRGMRQRVMLAKTLIPDPQVLMLDEPASGLDPHARIDLKNVIRGVTARGKTVLVSSHILSEMSEFCTAIGIMEKGRMVISGSVEDISRQVMGHAIISVEILDKEESMLSLLGRDRRAGPIADMGKGRFEFSYDGEDHEVSELLKQMVFAGIPLVSFGRKKEGLEDLFLKVGAKEVS